ncbi:hypothetical protein ACN28S_06085 [Cystobacter fuscus]
MQHVEGEHLGIGEAIALGDGEEEGSALALEDADGVLAHGAEGTQAHGAPVIQGLQQAGHVHPLLQGHVLGG